MEYLTLSHNFELTTLKTGMFNGLATVEYLALEVNNINYIEDKTFANLKKLEKLDLGNNDLKTLSPGMFSGLDSLKSLRLGGNHLTTLPENVFNHLPRPLTISNAEPYGSRTHNPLQCDLELCWLKLELLQGNITWYFGVGPICMDDEDWFISICNETGMV